MMKNKATWDETYEQGDDFMQLSTAELSFLLKAVDLTDGLKHLDVGCGTGQLNRDLYLRGMNSTGIDISASAIELAKESVDLGRFDIRFIYGDIEDLIENEFNFITMKYVYRFIKDRNNFLLNIKRILAKGGRFLVIDPAIESLPEHKRGIVLPEEQVKTELQQHFSVEVRNYRKNTYFIATLK